MFCHPFTQDDSNIKFLRHMETWRLELHFSHEPETLLSENETRTKSSLNYSRKTWVEFVYKIEILLFF